MRNQQVQYERLPHYNGITACFSITISLFSNISFIPVACSFHHYPRYRQSLASRRLKSYVNTLTYKDRRDTQLLLILNSIF